MAEKVYRVFVGNLPPDTVEDDLASFMKKYATVISVEIKHRNDDLFAFVNLKNPKIDIKHCLQKLSLSTWRGYQLRVQMARESFLERLARERLENQKDSMNNLHGKEWRTKSNSSNTEKIVIHDEIVQRTGVKETCDETEVCSSKSSDSEIPVKGHLPMFCGTQAMQGEEKEEKSLQKWSKQTSNKMSCSKIHEEKRILEKFESFNNVWKDEYSNFLVEDSCEYEAGKMKEQKRRVFSSNTIGLNNDIGENHSPKTLEELKHEEAEERRLKAMQDRRDVVLKRKNIIQFALASVDSMNNVQRRNKKKRFTEDGMQEISEKHSLLSDEQKLTLFSDDEKDFDLSNGNDFRIRDHYEGKKGRSLLELQARYGNDRRFVLDERFVESEISDEEKDETENNDTQAERQQVLRILGDVLGKEVSDKAKTIPKYNKRMLRYDPTKPDHVKFEIRETAPLRKMKKKEISKSENDKALKTDEVSNNIPLVSKERYSQVSETLFDALQNQNQKFSVMELFDENESEGEKGSEINLAEKPIMKNKVQSLNPFKCDSSESEDEYVLDKTTKQSNVQNNVGVKQENLFFYRNDARFIEGIEFIKTKNEEYINNFENMRLKIKFFVNKKIKNNRRKADQWKTKLGGQKKTPFSGKKRQY